MAALRDSIMAENLFWLTESVFEGEKVIVWAHNGHIMKNDFESGAVVGEYVHDRMPSESYAMGFVAYQGTAFEEYQSKDTIRFRHSDPGLLESRIAQLKNAQEVFLSFECSAGLPRWTDDSLRVSRNTTLTQTIVPSEAFDGVYFIRSITFENHLRMK